MGIGEDVAGDEESVHVDDCAGGKGTSFVLVSMEHGIDGGLEELFSPLCEICVTCVFVVQFVLHLLNLDIGGLVHSSLALHKGGVSRFA